MAQQAFGEAHQPLVIGVGLVELHHGEFGIVARAESFVAKIAVDLEHLLEAADHQTLQIQLRRDAQEQLHVQCIVVRGEGLGGGAARNRVHHRRFHFKEAVVHHVVADRLDHPAAGDEGETRLLVGDQVQLAAAILLLDVGKAVELLGQRAQRLGQQADDVAMHGQFAGLGLEQHAFAADDVAQVPALELLVHVLAGDVVADENLDPAGNVLNAGKAGLAHDALQHDAAGHLDLDRRGFEFLARFGAVEFVELAGEIFAREIVGEGFAGGAPLGKLFAALGDQAVFVGGGGGRRVLLSHDRELA